MAPRHKLSFVEVFLWLFAAAWTVGAILGLWRIAQGLYYHIDARTRYQPVEAVVLDGEVEARYISGAGGEGGSTSFIPRIRYSYVVGGREFTSRRYAHWWQTSDEELAKQIVAAYPKGLKTRAWYDPRQPDKAYLVLSQSGVWPGLAFTLMLPTIAAGVAAFPLGLLAYRRDLRRFVGRPSPPTFPWDVPFWGRFDMEGGTVTLRARYSWRFKAATFAPGFIAVPFVAGFAISGSESVTSEPWVALATIALAAPMGLISHAFFRHRFRAKGHLCISLNSQVVKLTTSKRSHAVGFEDIARWGVSMVLAVVRRSENGPERVPLLGIRATDGRDIPIHLFDGPDGTVIANEVARQLAALTGRPHEEWVPAQAGSASGANDTPADYDDLR